MRATARTKSERATSEECGSATSERSEITKENKNKMSQENSNRRATDAELAEIRQESDEKLASWKADLPPPMPPLSKEQEEAAAKAAKEREAEASKLSGKINEARKEYVKIYDESPNIWKLHFNERFNYLINRLRGKGITFNKEETDILRITLKNSTAKIRVLSDDYKEDPSKPDPLHVSKKAA